MLEDVELDGEVVSYQEGHSPLPGIDVTDAAGDVAPYAYPIREEKGRIA